ncbi:MAG: diguanylate phosphodiesterase, partial [Methylotenera sp.]|nr:diguanylate phosphodiesterase [Methylotenera sp.]
MEDQVFIGRQPILDVKEHIIGYELLFRHSAEALSAVFEDDI